MPVDHIPFHSSALLGWGVTVGNLSIWLGLASAVATAIFYWTGAVLRLRGQREQAAPAAASGARRVSGKGKNRSGPPQGRPSNAAEGMSRLGRLFFFIGSGCFVVGSIALWALIFGKEITVGYVHKNASDDLIWSYRLATFWADQEGTFFLWGLYNTILGLLLLRKGKDDAPWVMPFFSLVNISLFCLLTFMNPFWLASPEFVREALGSQGAAPELLAFLPTDLPGHIAYYFGWARYWPVGASPGLNESLRNFWMVIHPPTLFVGYSSSLLASCFALAALLRRDYDTWINRATPWFAFSWGVLAVGIFLGAYWAYETLGWGGYWMWDPVENSSIIPWVVSGALLHGMLAQRSRGNFKQANLFLGGLVGASVLLSSFLVRSGVLSENSVHSFATPQKSVFFTLLAILVLWTTLYLGIWIWRFRDIQSEIAYENLWERHFGFFLGVITLTASAFVIAFGVTVPIWKPWLPNASGLTIEHTFYNKALLPVFFIIVLLMAVTPLAPWRQRAERRRLKPFTMASLIAAGLLALAFAGAGVYAWSGGFDPGTLSRSGMDSTLTNATPMGVRPTQNDPVYVVFGLALLLGLVTNAVVLVRAVRGGLLQTGPWLAHLGFLLMLSGVLVTTRFKETVQVQHQEIGQPYTAFGRTFTYQGQRERQVGKTGDKDRMLIDFTSGGRTRKLDPPLFITGPEGEKTLMAWPYIIHEWFGGAWGDIYVVPNGVDLGNYNFANMEKEEPVGARVRYRSDSPVDEVILSFHGLDTSELQRAMQKTTAEELGEITIKADVELSVNGRTVALQPALQMNLDTREKIPVPVRVEGLTQPVGYTLQFTGTNMKPDDLEASFQLVPDTTLERGSFEVLKVPGIQVLWWGCYLMFLGAFVTWRNRARLANRAPAYDTPAADPVDGA